MTADPTRIEVNKEELTPRSEELKAKISGIISL